MARALGYALPSLAVAGGLGVLELLRGRFQHSRMFVPDRYPNGVWDPSPFGLDVEDVWIPSAGDVTLHGWWVRHPRPLATVLYCHGNSGSIAHRIGFFRYLRRLRVNLLAFDYRGYGRSTGRASERGLCADVRAAFEHLVGALGQAPERILLFGHSLGGAVAIDGAMECPVAGLIVQSSFTDVRSMARSLYPGLPLHWLARNQFRSIDKVGELAVPKLFVHGTEDGTVPFAHGRALFEGAAEPKQFLAIPGAGHNDVFRHGGWRYHRHLARFRSRCLGGGGSRRAPQASIR